MPEIYYLFVASLFTWRLSSMITGEDGPGDIFVKLRKLAGVQWDVDSREFGVTSLARGILCLWCVSIWVGFVAGIATWSFAQQGSFAELSLGDVSVFIMFWFAISAVAILFDGIVDYLKR